MRGISFDVSMLMPTRISSFVADESRSTQLLVYISIALMSSIFRISTITKVASSCYVEYFGTTIPLQQKLIIGEVGRHITNTATSVGALRSGVYAQAKIFNRRGDARVAHHNLTSQQRCSIHVSLFVVYRLNVDFLFTHPQRYFPLSAHIPCR